MGVRVLDPATRQVLGARSTADGASSVGSVSLDDWPLQLDFRKKEVELHVDTAPPELPPRWRLQAAALSGDGGGEQVVLGGEADASPPAYILGKVLVPSELKLSLLRRPRPENAHVQAEAEVAALKFILTKGREPTEARTGARHPSTT